MVDFKKFFFKIKFISFKLNYFDNNCEKLFFKIYNNKDFFK